MKKFLSFFLAVIIIITSLYIVSFATSESFAGITYAQTPTDSSALLFSKKFGGNYKGAPTPPVVVGDTIILVSGVKLYKLDAKTGEEIASVKMQGSTLYATVAPFYADGKIFVQLDEGIVQAFDYETMTSLWVYTDSLGGQAICPITYDGEYIYTGFWVSETEYANYVCLSVKDENTKKQTESKKAKWTYKSLGGFYWAGCLVTDDYIVFGKDDGKSGSSGSSKIIALNKSSGKSVSTLSVKGDIRSSVTYSSETNSCYVSSKAGYVYKFNINSSTGKLSSLKTYTAAGAVTGTPVVYNERLYVGCANGSKGEFIVLNASTMKEIYSCEMLGYPQATMLVSAGYEDTNGKIYIYSTYNSKPGGITVFEDSAGQKEAIKTELFTPDENMSEYCISTISASEDGTLYYKNDSGNIFAVSKKMSISSFLQKIFAFLSELLSKLKALFAQI
ncbi:MAG: PQQ-binding-like beta-propeller repeat protein [Clostridia bacterium]|nr:PQQ-binding-like beta-propeller repeat protein [Clostridia bacterium]